MIILSELFGGVEQILMDSATKENGGILMDDLISRSELVEKAEILYQHTSSGKIIPWSAVRVCDINNVSTIDAEPVRHGEWVDGDCSVCGYPIPTDDRFDAIFEGDVKYCYNCGTAMDGGKKDDDQ